MSNFIKSQHTEAQIGIGYALLAFSAWGFLPIYWKLLDTVPSLEILAHR
ncbi:MAG TPA: EamA family transporter RarD, partial [Deltaproteobacteria bacterium]|nr:EamA family transporter RarD [Deltaproteobacteria bacterium]